MTVVSDPVPMVYVKVVSLVTTVKVVSLLTMVVVPGAPVTPVPRGPVWVEFPGLELVGKGRALEPVPNGIDPEGA